MNQRSKVHLLVAAIRKTYDWKSVVDHLTKIFNILLAASILQFLMPASQPQSGPSCCSVEAERPSSNSCCAGESPRQLLCCTDETETPADNVAQIPAPGNKSLRVALDPAPQQSFIDQDILDFCTVNLAPDFFACNVLLNTNQRYKLSDLLLI